MGAENKIKSEKISRVNRAFQRGFSFFLRWFYLLIIVIASAYAVLIWKKYILNAEPISASSRFCSSMRKNIKKRSRS